MKVNHMYPFQFKERPICRKAIISRGLYPSLNSEGTWDGYEALTKEGTRTLLSEGMRKQMRKMYFEGYWN